MSSVRRIQKLPHFLLKGKSGFEGQIAMGSNPNRQTYGA